jgi:isochorismate hydrolase
MSEVTSMLPAVSGGYELTRFNALRHGVLSRYTVLPWEDADEYRALLEALVSEHIPQGPTEEHLVEEVAGILWRKRRLRLAEAAASGAG